MTLHIRIRTPMIAHERPLDPPEYSPAYEADEPTRCHQCRALAYAWQLNEAELCATCANPQWTRERILEAAKAVQDATRETAHMPMGRAYHRLNRAYWYAARAWWATFGLMYGEDVSAEIVRATDQIERYTQELEGLGVV